MADKKKKVTVLFSLPFQREHKLDWTVTCTNADSLPLNLECHKDA